MRRTIEWQPRPDLKGSVYLAEHDGVGMCIRRNLPHEISTEDRFVGSGFVAYVNGEIRVLADTPLQCMLQVEEYLRSPVS